MQRKLILLFLLIVGIFTLQADPWEDKGSPEKAKAAYEYYKELYEAEPNYENSWKFARIAQRYGAVVLSEDEKEMRKIIFEEGKAAAEKAVELQPRGVEGQYYFATNLGSWGEANGIMSSLFAVKDMLSAANVVIEEDKSYNNAGAIMTRARLYHKAPGWPISIGSDKKAEADYKEAIALAPSNRVVHRFYAEFLIEQKRKDEAALIIAAALNIPVNPVNLLQEKLEISLLKELESQL